MSKRTYSSPELVPTSGAGQDCSNLEGVATNVMLLLKLIQDHNEASGKDHDDRRTQRVAGMMTILDDVKVRIQSSQSNVGKKKEAELRRCKTELKQPSNIPKKSPEPITDEVGRLRKELSASLAARKSLEMMCSSLGKEKEIMATELAKKVHEFNEMEEMIGYLKEQNETLSAKVHTYAAEQKDKRGGGDRETQGNNNAALQERNRALSEQLLKSLDGYRSLKRRYKEAKEENMVLNKTMEEIREDFSSGLGQIRKFKSMAVIGGKSAIAATEEISAIEQMFKCLEIKVSKHHEQQKGECGETKAEINPAKPPVVA